MVCCFVANCYGVVLWIYIIDFIVFCVVVLMNECLHIEKYENLDGDKLERPWNRIFCPDCGVRIVGEYKTDPFKLRGR